MNVISSSILTCFCTLFSFSVFGQAPLVYNGKEGLGVGKRIVFIASDHEYRSEETLPALARILAKRHGFKCSVVFGVNAKGEIQPGASNVPGIEELAKADLMVIFTRFQNWSWSNEAFRRLFGPCRAHRWSAYRNPWVQNSQGQSLCKICQRLRWQRVQGRIRSSGSG